MQVAEALDDFERRLEQVETALDDGDVADLGAFEPVDLDGPLTQAHVDRLERAMTRFRVLQRRVQSQRVAVLAELAQLDRRRDAATAYIANG